MKERAFGLVTTLMLLALISLLASLLFSSITTWIRHRADEIHSVAAANRARTELPEFLAELDIPARTSYVFSEKRFAVGRIHYPLGVYHWSGPPRVETLEHLRSNPLVTGSSDYFPAIDYNAIFDTLGEDPFIVYTDLVQEEPIFIPAPSNPGEPTLLAALGLIDIAEIKLGSSAVIIIAGTDLEIDKITLTTDQDPQRLTLVAATGSISVHELPATLQLAAIAWKDVRILGGFAPQAEPLLPELVSIDLMGLY